MSTSKARGVLLARLAAVFLVLLATYLVHDFWLANQYYPQVEEQTPPVPFTPPVSASSSGSIQHTEPDEVTHNDGRPSQSLKATSHSCINAPGAEKVMVIMKTGATELYRKLPIHFVTTFQCIPPSNLLIASDLEQTFGQLHVFDALAMVSPKYRDHHPDFELYRKLRQYQQEGQDLQLLQGDVSWNLDKWKFLPMLHRAFDTAKESVEWFVVIEADTSLSWTNLLQWLSTMDATQPWYLGSQNFIGSTAFAHGGSGIVISRKAADMLQAVRHKEGVEAYDARWENDLVDKCCGDEVIARAFLEANVALTPTWPPIQGETVASLDWTEKHWCAPAISWHHVSPPDLDALWQFERAWVDGHGWNSPYLFRDIFAHFVERHIHGERSRWNNLSKDKVLVDDSREVWIAMHDVERAATQSKEECAMACAHPMFEQCVQWMYSPGRCHLGFEIRFGRSDEREEEHWTSGWILEKLESFKYKHRDCSVRWKGVDE